MTVAYLVSAADFCCIGLSRECPREKYGTENLVEFKKAYGESIRAVGRCLDKFCPEMNKRDKEEFLYVYFPFMYGIYPYAVVTEKQRKAMEDAGVGFVYHSVYELSYNCLKKLLVKGESQ